MRRLGVLALLLLLATGVSAKTLTNDAGIAPATDSVYAAVDKLNDEVTRIYTYLNTLFKLQAATGAPTGNSTYDMWLDTSSTPALKYYNGATWTTLVNPSGYASGLSLGDSVVGLRENCILDMNSPPSKVARVNSSVTKPCTIEDDGNLLQVTSAVTYDFASTAEDIYYIKPVRTGTTTAFTLGVDTVQSAGTNYFGEVHTNGSAGDIVNIIDYGMSELEAVARNPLAHAFYVSYSGSASVSTTPTAVLTFDTVVSPFTSNSEFSFSTYRHTPKQAGWYEYIARMVFVATPSLAQISIWKNGASAGSLSYSTQWIEVHAVVYMDGLDDYVYAGGSVADSGRTFYGCPSSTDTNCTTFFGRYLGSTP